MRAGASDNRWASALTTTASAKPHLGSHDFRCVINEEVEVDAAVSQKGVLPRRESKVLEDRGCVDESLVCEEDAYSCAGKPGGRVEGSGA